MVRSRSGVQSSPLAPLGAVSSVVERFVDIEEVRSSILLPRTRIPLKFSVKKILLRDSVSRLGGATKYDMYYVYILKSKATGIYYIGYTNNLNGRIKRHNSGKTKSLVKHLPLEIVKVEEYKFYEDARKRERQLKKYKSGEAFKKLLK